jgi:phage protein D
MRLRPYFKVSVDGLDISNRLSGRLIGLTLTDKRGMEADQLTLEIDDSDGQIAIPKLGAIVKVALGFDPARLIDKGAYVADEAGHQGPPDVLTVQARATDLRDDAKAQKTRSFHEIRLSEIAEIIAKENGLKPIVDPQYRAWRYRHVDQTNESDLHFLTRLAKKHDAIATVKEDRLLLMPAGRGVAVSGKALPTVHIARAHGDAHHYQINDRDKYTGVKAIWHEYAAATEHSVLVGDAETAKTLYKRYPTEQEARAAAEAAFKSLARGRATLSLNLAVGRPEIVTESPVRVVGFKPEIDRQAWVISQTVHSLDAGSGLTTQLELETLEDGGGESPFPME